MFESLASPAEQPVRQKTVANNKTIAFKTTPELETKLHLYVSDGMMTFSGLQVAPRKPGRFHARVKKFEASADFSIMLAKWSL